MNQAQNRLKEFVRGIALQVLKSSKNGLQLKINTFVWIFCEKETKFPVSFARGIRTIWSYYTYITCTILPNIN